MRLKKNKIKKKKNRPKAKVAKAGRKISAQKTKAKIPAGKERPIKKKEFTDEKIENLLKKGKENLFQQNFILKEFLDALNAENFCIEQQNLRIEEQQYEDPFGLAPSGKIFFDEKKEINLRKEIAV